MKVPADKWDIVEHATDRLLEAVEDGKLTAMDARSHFLGIIDAASGLDLKALEDVAQTAAKYAVSRYHA